MRPPVSAGPVPGGTRPAGRHQRREGQFAGWWHQFPSLQNVPAAVGGARCRPGCYRGWKIFHHVIELRRPPEARIRPGAPQPRGGLQPRYRRFPVGFIPGIAMGAPGGADSGGSARPGAAALPSQRQETKRRERGDGRLRFKAPRECPSTPPGVSVRPFHLHSQGRPGFYCWARGNNQSALGRGWCPFGARLVPVWGADLAAPRWGSGSWESAGPEGSPAQGCLASPRLCPGFLRLRGIGISRGGLTLADKGGWSSRGDGF